MARPPSFSVEEFQALISLTLDLKESCHEAQQGHSRVSSPNLVNEFEYGPAGRWRGGEDSEGGVRLGHAQSFEDDYVIQSRTRRWTESQVETGGDHTSGKISRAGCECDCPCGCGYVGKWLGSSGTCERCERKCARRSRSCRPPAIDADDDEKRRLGFPSFLAPSPALPSTTPPPRRKRRFSLSTSTALGLGAATPRTPSPSPLTSHAVSSSLLSKVNRAFRRISLSSSFPNTPVSNRKAQPSTAPNTPSPGAAAHVSGHTQRTHRRSSSNAFSTHSAHTPTLTPTKEERHSLLKTEDHEQEGEGREDEEARDIQKKRVDLENRLRSDDIEKDSGSKLRRAQGLQPHYKPHSKQSHQQGKQQHQWDEHQNEQRHQQHQQHHRHHTHQSRDLTHTHQSRDLTHTYQSRDLTHSPSSCESCDSTPHREFLEYSPESTSTSTPVSPSTPETPSLSTPESPSTPTEPATPSTFASERIEYHASERIEYHTSGSIEYHTSERIEYHAYANPLVLTMLAIAPVGAQGMLTPSMEDVVGCMGGSSGDEGGSGAGVRRDKSRERREEKSRERKEKSRERKEKSRERKADKSRERKADKSREREKKENRVTLNLNDSQVIQLPALPANFNGATPSPTPTPTKLQFSFPLGMFSPSSTITSGTASGDMSTSTPNTPVSPGFAVGIGSHNSPSSGGSESEDPARGRKLSMLGRLKKGLSIAGRSKGPSGVPGGGSSPVSPLGTTYEMRGVYGADGDVGVRSESVLAREREELEREVDLRFVMSPSPMPSSGHGHEGSMPAKGRVGGGGDDDDGVASIVMSEESASLSVEVARRGAGEGGLPSVCVTFATSSASGSGSGCASPGLEEGGEGSGSSGSTSGGGSRRGRRKKTRRKKKNANGGDLEGTCASSSNAATIMDDFSMASIRMRGPHQPVPASTKSSVLSPQASMATLSSPSNYSCSSYVGSVSSFFAADAIEREREWARGGGNGNMSSSSGGKKSSMYGGGGNVSSSSGGKKSMDGASFLSLDLSGSEGSASDDTSRGGGRGKRGIDGASFIEFGEDVDSDREKERRKRGVGMTSTPTRKDHRGKKRASVVLFRGGTSPASPQDSTTPSNGAQYRGAPGGCTPNNTTRADMAYQSLHDTSAFKPPSITSRSDISIFSGSTNFEFAPVVDDDDIPAGHHNPSTSTGKIIHHASSPPDLHRSGMEPTIRVYDVDADSLGGSSRAGHGAPSVDAMSVSARSVDAFSVDAMSVNSDETDYIPFLPLVLQHERLQKTLRKPVSMEAVVSANEAGRGVARSVRSVASVASMASGGSANGGMGGSVNGGLGERQRRTSAVRLDPRSAHLIGNRSKVASRLGSGGSETSLGGSSTSSSKAYGSKRLPSHVSESIAGVRIPFASNASRAPSICSSVGTEESAPARNGPAHRASGATLRVQTELDLDVGARRVVVCGSGLDAGVEDLREGRISMSSEDGAGSVLVSEDAQSQRGTVVDLDEDALEVTPTPTPRATVFVVNALEVSPSVNSTPSSKKTFIAPHTLSTQSSIGSIRRTPSRQALKATPPRAPPSDPLPLPPLSPSAASSSSSGSDNRARLSPFARSGAVSTPLSSDVISVSSGASVSVIEGEREVRMRSANVENVEEGKKGRLRLSVQASKDLWRARKKASAVGMGPEPRPDALSPLNLDNSTRLIPQNNLPAPNANVGVAFPSSRSLSFSPPSTEKRNEKLRVGEEIDGDVLHQKKDRDLIDGGEGDCASILRTKERSSQSLKSDDEGQAGEDDHDDESIDLDSDSMRQLLAANTSANAAMHSNLDVHKIGMGRQVIVPSPPSKKKSTNKLKEIVRARTSSSLGVGMEWTLGLGETDSKDEEKIPARHASYSGLKKVVKAVSPEPEVFSHASKKTSRLSDTPSTGPRARTKSESAVRALDSGSARGKKARSVLPDFDDWTLSLPLPSPRDYERSRKVSELGASIGLASLVNGEKPKEQEKAGHRHSAAPTASKRHTLDHKKRRASHHPIARVEDVDSGVDLEASRGDDEPSEDDEDDLRTPPLTTHVAQAFVVPRVVSLVDTLDSERIKQSVSSSLNMGLEGGDVQVLDVQSEVEMAVVEEELEEDTPATRTRSNLAKLDALSADLKRFNDLLRSGHPGSGRRKGEVSVRSFSSHNESARESTLPVSHPEPFSYAVKLKHVRSCEPFESREPVDDPQPPAKNALFRTSCANLRESVLSSLASSDNESGNEDSEEDDASVLSVSTLMQQKTSQSSMKRQSNPRISLSKSHSSLSPVIQSPNAAEEDINCSSIDVMDIPTPPAGLAANAVFGPAKWGKSSSLGRSVLPGHARTSARAPLPFAPPVGEGTATTSLTVTPPNGTNERKPKKLRDGIADISPTLRNAVSSIELGRMVPIVIPAQPIPPPGAKMTSAHVGDSPQYEATKLAVPRIPSGKKLAVPPTLSVQISPMRRSSIILSDMTPTSATSSAFPTPLASSFPIPPSTLPSLPLDFELGATKMAQAVPPTPPAPLQEPSSTKPQQGRPSTASSSTSTINASVVQRMKERLENLGKNVAKTASPTRSISAEGVEHEGDTTDQSSLCSGAYYSARSSFSEERGE